MKRNILRSALTSLVGVAFVLFSFANVAAATSTTAAPTSATNTLKISPLKTDVSIAAGTSAQVNTFVTNLTSSAISVEPIENDFIAGPNENGEPAIILNQNQYAPTHSLKRFMQPLPANVTIPAGQIKEVTVTITIPKTAQAGGYFGALRFAPTNGASGQSVDLNPSVASLILVTVPGPTTERLALTNFDVQQNGSTGTNFGKPDNLSLLVRFENEGNLQEAPFGQIYVQKGKKIVYTYNFNQNDPKAEILPDSARRWSIPISSIGKFGKYTVGADFSYGVNKTISIDVSKSIWIIPKYVIFGVIGAIILIIVVILLIRFSLKSYKRRILRSSPRRR